MRVEFVLRAIVIGALCTSLGCQNGIGRSSSDFWSRKSPPPKGAEAPKSTAETPASSTRPAAKVTYVGYAPDADGTTIASSDAAKRLTPSRPGQEQSLSEQSDEEEGFLTSLLTSPTSTFHIESAITRGQTPLRNVFVSDRFIVGAIVVAAVVIPFAVHDSRQANPPVPIQ